MVLHSYLLTPLLYIERVNEFLGHLDTGGMSCNPARRVRVLYRVEISRQLYSSAHYNRVKRRNTYTVMYMNNDGIDTFGLIHIGSKENSPSYH